MNKQELIERIKKLPFFEGPIAVTVTVNREWILKSIEQLDEPQKVKIPKFVADWIEYCKNTFLSLARALMVSEDDFYNYANQKDHLELLYFLGSMINQEKFAKAWIYGYEVEREKRYLVKMKGIAGYGRYLNKALSSGEYFFASENEVDGYRAKHTRKELENSGFSWVFDCPGIEVREVKK
ncbi:DUF1642 domain-containing protein [Streptococcus australis]|uniref:DUF1642 domain-containing protein n=1 Tax=Streptococcus australis TaxID=113107 RepID=UPI0039C48E5B